MNDDPFVTRLRADLLRGAARRRRAERRRTVVLTATPLLLALVAAGAFLFGRELRDDVTTETGPSPEVVEACDALSDAWHARSTLDPGRLDAAMTEFRRLAAVSDDPELRELAPGLVPPRTNAVDERFIDDFVRAADRCRALRVPSWTPVYVPARLGPAPQIDLAAYGEVVEWKRLTDGDALPVTGTVHPVGRGLSPVRALRTDAGAWVAVWTIVDAIGATSECWSIGVQTATGSGSSGGCPGGAPRSAGITAAGTAAGAGFLVREDAAFVVLEVDGAAYVQRPAENVVLFAGVVVTPGDGAVARAYGSDGIELACTDGRTSTWSDDACD
jgi:hypothetical protein